MKKHLLSVIALAAMLVGCGEKTSSTVAPTSTNSTQTSVAASSEEVVTSDVTSSIEEISDESSEVISSVSSAEEEESSVSSSVEEVVIEVESVTIDALKEYVLHIGQKVSLQVIVLPENATDPTVTFKSSNPEVLSVTGAGLVTALKAGKATITATAGEKSDTVELTVAKDKIADIKEIGKEYSVEGKVMARSTNSFILYDGERAIQVYVGNNGELPEIGSSIAVTATAAYGGGKQDHNLAMQLSSPTIEVLPAELDIDDPEPEILNANTLGTLVYAADSVPSDIVVAPYSWTATVGKEGNYFTLNLDGNETLIEPAYPTQELVVGETYDVVGWYLGYNTKYNYVSMLLESVKPHVFAVEEINLDAVPTTLSVGSEALLTASVLPAKAEQGVTWSVEDLGSNDHTSSRAELVVKEDGTYLKAIADGSVVVTATSVGLGADGEKVTASIEVMLTNVSVPATDITLNETSVELNEDENFQIVATVAPEDSTDAITYRSEDATIASVSATGLITAVKAGETTIFVTAGEIVKSISVKVTSIYGTVDAPLTVAQANALAEKVEGSQTAKPVTMRAVIKSHNTWTKYNNFDNSTILADPDDSSEIAAYRATTSETDYQTTTANALVGYTVLVVGTLENGSHGIQFVAGTVLSNFTAPSETITSISLNESTYTMGKGETFQLVHSFLPLNAIDNVAYSSSDDGVATVSETGLVTAVEGGTCTITAASGSVSATCEITVKAASKQVAYTLDGTATGGSSGYAEASTITQNSVTWSVVGNTTMSPWRIGGKNLTNVDRAVTSTKVVSAEDISSIEIELGTKNLKSLNSLTVKVGTTSGANDISEIVIEGSKLKLSDINVIEKDDAEKSWADRYFTFVFNVSAGSSNQYVQLKAINFYYFGE